MDCGFVQSLGAGLVGILGSVVGWSFEDEGLIGLADPWAFGILNVGTLGWPGFVDLGLVSVVGMSDVCLS